MHILSTQLAVAQKIVPGFENIGFIRGRAKQLTSQVWVWELPDGNVVPATMADSESSCTLAVLKCSVAKGE